MDPIKIRSSTILKNLKHQNINNAEKPNDFLPQLMINRRSIRNYQKNQFLTDEQIGRIIKASFYPPSGGGFRLFHMIIVDSKDMKKKIRKICEKGEYEWVYEQKDELKNRILSLPNFTFEKAYLEDASILIIVSTNPKDENFAYTKESTWLGIGYMLLEIENLGLGSLTYTPSICLSEKGKVLNKLLGLPETDIIQIVIPCGMIEKKGTKRDKDFTEKVFRNKYGNKF